MASSSVTFLNPRSCGIYKDGGVRYKTDSATGLRTTDVDNELLAHVESYLADTLPEGAARVPLQTVFAKQVLVPTYFDDRFNEPIADVCRRLSVEPITLGELLETNVISVRGGHGSPGNDQRTGHIPYVKVSDIRGLRINVNPTNLLRESVARRFWRGEDSKLRAWDVITPNRASSNIGEFAMLLPGEEKVVLTKEVFVFRVMEDSLFDPFYLLWALSLRAVRDQWRRIALMQTNREDCGQRYREVMLPAPPTKKWAIEQSGPFRDYFTTIAKAKERFVDAVTTSDLGFIASVASMGAEIENDSGPDAVDATQAETLHVPEIEE